METVSRDSKSSDFSETIVVPKIDLESIEFVLPPSKSHMIRLLALASLGTGTTMNLFQGVPVRLEQVFMNLLKNALEAIQEKVLLKEEYVIVKTSQSHHQICIEISDSGVGMSADTQQKIFSDDFTTKPKGKGVGMGLCKRIIEEHCGTIEIISVLGKGTKVSIYLDTT